MESGTTGHQGWLPKDWCQPEVGAGAKEDNCLWDINSGKVRTAGCPDLKQPLVSIWCLFLGSLLTTS